MSKRFTRILVANRGEIAVRVIRTARAQGYGAVAVFSEADRDARHVRDADYAVCIGPAPAAESYLSIERVIEAAKRSGADAVHPGYGFLSERADFAQAVVDAGLVFVGPDPGSIEAMGNKSAAKARMIEAGVPCVPGYQGTDQSDDTLAAEARRIGFPVMIKAAAGGGGRGMRLVDDDAVLLEQIRSARSEAASAFGSGELLIEKAVTRARHVEIQVFGDRHGNVVHLGERDCSVQRRNQKVLEESPSPAVDDDLRRRMGAAAIAAARAVDYVGAGTVEFMLAADGQFYFLEMNTRLQVEHPVTEAVYGLDLVEWQLLVAQGSALPLTQQQIDARRSGWAIEARLCAEDPTREYLPQAGQVLRWRAPQGEGIRVDTGLHTGQVISPYYDSMQGKIIAWGKDRETARARLAKALDDTVLLGVLSNKVALRSFVGHDAFADGHFDTGFIARHFPQSVLGCQQPTLQQIGLVVVALYLDDARRLADEHALGDEFKGWHSSHVFPTPYSLRWRDRLYRLEMAVRSPRRFEVRRDESVLSIEVERHDAEGFVYAIDGVGAEARVARDGTRIWLEASGCCEVFEDVTLAPAQSAAAGSDGRLLANSDGKIVAVSVAAGDVVEKGQTLAILEAMKMEFRLSLPVGGTVVAVSTEVGQQVRNRQLLVQIEPTQTDRAPG